jgi:hypothetical protein
MAPRNREPTNAQLSSRLRYDQGDAPAFLSRLRAQVSGHAHHDEDEPSYEYEDEFDGGDGGRPPIPRRPPIPTRPDGEAGSGDERDGKGTLDEEDAEDEAPQIVVVKEGKHLSEREVENEKRKGVKISPYQYLFSEYDVSAKGLPPLPETTSGDAPTDMSTSLSKPSKTKPSNLSGVTFGGPKKSTKRKVIGDDEPSDVTPVKSDKDKKKTKKQKKTLLSFGDDAWNIDFSDSTGWAIATILTMKLTAPSFSGPFWALEDTAWSPTRILRELATAN